MNCKPGDLALLVQGDPWLHVGRLCEVLHACPTPPFPLGGHVVEGTTRECHWWVRWLGTAVRYPVFVRATQWGQLTRPVQEGPCPDAWLRPLRGDPGLDETLQLVELPSPLGVEHIE